MKKVVKHLYEITRSAWRDVKYFIKFNLRYFVAWLNMLLPYGMYYIGKSQTDEGIAVLWIPVIVTVVLHYAREYANRNNVGNVLPIPNQRFTQVDDDGEVTVEHCRVQELLLYMADLEDWLQRKGML